MGGWGDGSESGGRGTSASFMWRWRGASLYLRYLRPVTGPLSHLVVIPSVRPQATPHAPPPRPCGTSLTSRWAESVTHRSPGGSRPRLKRVFNSALVGTAAFSIRGQSVASTIQTGNFLKCFQRRKLIAIRSTPNPHVLFLMIDFQTTENSPDEKRINDLHCTAISKTPLVII